MIAVIKNKFLLFSTTCIFRTCQLNRNDEIWQHSYDFTIIFIYLFIHSFDTEYPHLLIM